MNTHKSIYGYLNASLYSAPYKKISDEVDNCSDILSYFGKREKSPPFKADEENYSPDLCE